MSRNLLVIAGEISGDMHLANVVRALKQRDPDIRFWGIAGDACEREGVEIKVHARDMAVMGLFEVLKRYTFFNDVFKRMFSLAVEEKPDAVLLVDYPGFNLRFAEVMREEGIKVIYYICPQVWAWKQSRIPKMARFIDRLLVIFPFEVEVFKNTDLRVDFVGHPLMAEAREALRKPLEDLPWTGTPRVALLPGSRRQEILRILPVMLEAAAGLERSFPGSSFILAAPSENVARMAREILEKSPGRVGNMALVVDRTRQVLRQADAAWVASGTATIEAALMGCPMVVIYKTSLLNYAIAKRVVKVPNIGMVNIVAGHEICPELIQDQATPENLMTNIEPLLSDTPERQRMVEALGKAARSLGDHKAFEKTAEAILEEL